MVVFIFYLCCKSLWDFFCSGKRHTNVTNLEQVPLGAMQVVPAFSVGLYRGKRSCPHGTNKRQERKLSDHLLSERIFEIKKVSCRGLRGFLKKGFVDIPPKISTWNQNNAGTTVELCRTGTSQNLVSCPSLPCMQNVPVSGSSNSREIWERLKPCRAVANY